jgi:hypothetical protein
VKFDCTNQGLHVGWWDVYPTDKPCQWIDVTDVQPGNYILDIQINYAQVIPESDYSNNEIRIPVVIPANPPRGDGGI